MACEVRGVACEVKVWPVWYVVRVTFAVFSGAG